MSRFSDFFEENIEKADVFHAFAPSDRFKEKVKDCKVQKDFSYEERGVQVKAGGFFPIAVKYISKYVTAGVIEENPKASEYVKKIDWQFRATTPDMAKNLRKECGRKEEVRKGYFQKFTDYDEYMEKLVIACTVYPDLKDAQLQDNYGVRSEAALLKRILPIDGELSEVKEFVNKINGFDAQVEEKQAEAKN